MKYLALTLFIAAVAVWSYFLGQLMTPPIIHIQPLTHSQGVLAHE